MKLSLSCFFLILVSGLAAADLQTAEQLLASGEFEQCKRVLDELLKTEKLPEEQMAGVLAMKEYLLGADPAGIARTVKQARQTAAHSGWLTADRLKHAAILIRRAEEWKMRGIPEYQELSDAAADLLKQARDNGNTETVLKIVFLQTRNHNLNGEYQEPQKIIQETLRLYYPAKRLQGKKLPDGAIQLLLLAAEQFIGSGIQAREERVKVNAFSEAANYLLRVAKVLPPNDPRFQELCSRLHYCRETLRLLGYRLELPAGIRPGSAVKTAMADDMLRAGRYQDVVLALENAAAPELKIRYAAALAAIGRTDKATAVLAEEKNRIREPHFLLKIAGNALAGGQKEHALHVLKRYLAEVPEGPDSIRAARTCAGILFEQKKYDEGIGIFTRLAESARDNRAKEQFRFIAARCMYQAKEYRKCIAALEPLPAGFDRSLLIAQAKINLDDLNGARRELDGVLKRQTVSGDERCRALKLAISCAAGPAPPDAEEYINIFLREYAEMSESLDYAGLLLTLYERRKAPSGKYRRLASWCIAHRLHVPEALPVFLKCIGGVADEKQKEQLLRALLKRPSLSPRELSLVMPYLRSPKLKQEFFSRYKPEFDNTPEICALYHQLARLEFEQKGYEAALAYCTLLLKQEEVFHYNDCKFLQAASLDGLKRDAEARQAYQELLLAELTGPEKARAVLALARSWERSGEAKKAVAVAWSGIPVNPGNCGKEEIIPVKQLLHLIVDNSEKISSQADREDAREILGTLR